MDQTLIRELAREHATSALSIFCALDTKDAGNDRDPKVLAALEHDAADKIETQIVGSDAAAALRWRVSRAIASIDLAHPTAGVAIYVSPETSRVVPLPRAVENRVLLGNQFALRSHRRRGCRLPGPGRRAVARAEPLLRRHRRRGTRASRPRLSHRAADRSRYQRAASRLSVG